MNSTYNAQLDQAPEYIKVNDEEEIVAIPSGLTNFKQIYFKTEPVIRNIGTKQKPYKHRTYEYHLNGFYDDKSDKSRICPKCGAILHKNGLCTTSLRHIPMGGKYSVVEVQRYRYRCSNENCEYSEVTDIPFKSKEHLLTEPLREYAETLLAYGMTLKEVAHITGLHKNVVKDIDKARLESLYVTVDKKGHRALIKPETQARYLGIDEFKLHDSYRYATLIMNMETGCILWLQAGKKKKVVYDFIDHVGLERMSKVEAVSSDMNSDFEEAFKEKSPHLKIVYDYFHLVKNFNDKVVSQVRKDEQKRLIEVGDIEGAKALKGCKYILTSKKATLRTKDNDAFLGKEISKGSEFFKKESVEQTGNQLGRYYTLLCQNELLFSLDFLKEAVESAYRENTTDRMKAKIEYIIKFCEDSENEHFQWVGKFLKDHFDGIVSLAKYPLSYGKVEGVNQKSKTIRRKSYGLPDDECFFLKLFDASRQRWRSLDDD